MRERPRSRFEDEYGIIGPEGFTLVISGVPEYPEVKAWAKEYADECDRLAELEAEKMGSRCWGRWYLNTSGGLVSLDTMVWHPEQGEHPAWRGGDYYIMLDRCKTEKECQNWVEHMREKNWLGEKGLTDLTRAFAELSQAKEELKAGVE